jgi:hypothetical protein
VACIWAIARPMSTRAACVPISGTHQTPHPISGFALRKWEERPTTPPQPHSRHPGFAATAAKTGTRTAARRPLEHFPTKWEPVSRKKMRPINKLEHFPTQREPVGRKKLRPINILEPQIQVRRIGIGSRSRALGLALPSPQDDGAARHAPHPRRNLRNPVQAQPPLLPSNNHALTHR